jgi:hypothetical protein
VNCGSPVHLPYGFGGGRGPWAIAIGTGQKTRAFVLAAGFLKLVDGVDSVDERHACVISNTKGHLYQHGNDALFSSRSFQFQR